MKFCGQFLKKSVHGHPPIKFCGQFLIKIYGRVYIKFDGQDVSYITFDGEVPISKLMVKLL